MQFIRTKKFWTEGFGSVLLLVLFALSIRWAIVEAYVIPSGSMLPTLLVRDHIFVNKMAYGTRWPWTSRWIAKWSDPKRGDIIVFLSPEDGKTFYIKRVVGIPGDRIFYEDGSLYLNDELVQKTVPSEDLKKDFEWLRDKDFLVEGPGAVNNYTHWSETMDGKLHYSVLLRKQRPWKTFGPITVPKGSYFVMGDNRNNSHDSRFWPEHQRFVSRNDIMGRALFVWLSCDETLGFPSFLCNPLELRWSRFFHGIK